MNKGDVGVRSRDSCPASRFAHKKAYVYRSRMEVRGWG